MASNLPKGWSFGGGSGGGNWRYGNDPMSPLLDEKVTGPGGMGVGLDQPAPTLQQIIDALQSHADQTAVGVSGETPTAQVPASGPPADTLASVATGQMSPAGGSGGGPGGGAEGAAPSSDAGEAGAPGGDGSGSGSGGGDGGGSGSGAGSAMRRGGRVRDRHPEESFRKGGKVRKHDAGGFSVGRGRR